MKPLRWLALLLLPALALAQGGPNQNGGVTGNLSTGGGGSLPTCTVGEMVYYATNGNNVACLTVGTNLSITSGTLNATGGSAGVSSVAAGNGIAVSGTGTGPYTGDVTISASYSIRPVTTGSTDTILAADCANGVNYTSASAVAITLPQATGSFAACSVDVINNSAVTETVTPTTSTINGASSLTVPAGTSVNITALSGNYIAAGTAVGTLTHTIASGTATLGTSAIASGACATAVTVSAPGVLTTDTVTAGFNGDPTSTTGYLPSTSGMLTIVAYPAANDAVFKVCNLTSASVTPGAVTLNWKVVR